MSEVRSEFITKHCRKNQCRLMVFMKQKILCILEITAYFYNLLIFSKINFSKSSFRNTISGSNGLDQVYARHLTGLIWVQTDCKDYLLGTKFVTSMLRVNVFEFEVKVYKAILIKFARSHTLDGLEGVITTDCFFPAEA